MDHTSLLERLARHRRLGGTPESEQRWLVDHGEFRHVPAGGFFTRRGDRPEYLGVLLSGHLAIQVDRGFGPRRVMEWRSGDVNGIMPYSRLRTVPGDVEALEPSDLLSVHERHFPAMIRECPDVTATLVHEMIDRARTFNTSERQDEKMLSLGRMAAGLAHELNNPASAVRRSAQLLADRMGEAEDTMRVLAAARLSTAQLDAIDRGRHVCGGPIGDLAPLARADREEALDDWLQAHGVDAALTPVLMDTGATPDLLDELHGVLQGDAFEPAIRWIGACCSVRTLSAELVTAATRMHDLVSAVKRFTYMDQAQAPEPVDLAQGLRDSVSLASHKARDKSVTIALDLPLDLPAVQAIGSDLNQVWTNLIDNAIDAAPPSGHVTVAATTAPKGVLVSVIDDGPGIPAELRERIFEAFFSTKGVGKGTGLGLEIARRLVFRNNGDIEVDSVPGRTEFRVLLRPVRPAPDAHTSPVPS